MIFSYLYIIPNALLHNMVFIAPFVLFVFLRNRDVSEFRQIVPQTRRFVLISKNMVSACSHRS